VKVFLQQLCLKFAPKVCRSINDVTFEAISRKIRSRNPKPALVKLVREAWRAQFDEQFTPLLAYRNVYEVPCHLYLAEAAGK